MFKMLKKVVFAFLLLMVVVSTGAWQSSNASAAAGIPETPLMTGLNWKDLGQTVRSIQLTIQGDTLELSGQTFQAAEKFSGGVPQEISEFYSNAALYKFGWVSDNAYDAEDGLHQVFYHRAGVYLAIDFVKCADDADSTCVTVWKSAHKDSGKFVAGKAVQKHDRLAVDPTCVDPTALFCKNKNFVPNGALNINPTSVYLSWSEYLPSLKYSYCIKEGGACAINDPNWTGTFLNRSVVKTDLRFHKVYYWQVKAFTCMVDCLPKTFVLADKGSWWLFTTAFSNVTISGNAGVSGATLKWVDTDKVTKSTTSNSSGNYSISVPINWTGKITPTKTNYSFAPAARTYSEKVTENKTGQNFTATEKRFTISGNVGIGLGKVTYVDGGTKSIIADSNGNYSFTVPVGWSGVVTPSSAGVYSFTPGNRTYNYLNANKTAQNFRANMLLEVASNGTDDGFVVESTEFSNVGGSRNATDPNIQVGDTNQNQQKRAILSFNTSSLPDDAKIISARIKLRRITVIGNNPMNTHGWLLFDIKKSFLGSTRALANQDFQAPADLDFAGWLDPTPSDNLYAGAFTKTAFPFLNRTGLTQVRLRFQVDDNNNLADDSIVFYSGNELNVSLRPILEIIYSLP